MHISLILNTYDNPKALAAVLRSVSRQTVLPDEVVIGDDGSGQETQDLILGMTIGAVPIHHAWHPHDGFRLARSRNSAIAKASGEYLIFSDGDVLLHERFIEDHARAARSGYFIQGTRVCLDEKRTTQALDAEVYWPSFFTPGVRHRRCTVRSQWLSWLAQRVSGRLCGNFSLWRKDVERVNGFNEDFVGWGLEDNEFVVRLRNAGVMRKRLGFTALCCHLDHPFWSRAQGSANFLLLQKTIAEGRIHCENGLDSHAR